MTTAKLDLINPAQYLTPELVNQCTMDELVTVITKLGEARNIVMQRHSLVYRKARDIYEKQYPGKDFVYLPHDLKPAWYSLAAKQLEEEAT